ncbi:MAG: prolipoprotein diacylglyceryl transferase, partial [Gammaproteobacteria bacterium]|nr:prolipoprotein diacylglyceryl transferase [Gammaproteobacteria bacterium]NIT53445.1 prolipoprotein diacylglyceryl transferase [candidate division Zixibacteria bacterium]NIW43564.1 prolipoprotein diacylglyceryl transferase [Gammaproteobacteria bacterium]NIX58148.1 prolipoprotein diacylglyceryl transferase [candidate division Zixibacteria bacterium]
RAKQINLNTEQLNAFVLVIILWAVIGARIFSVLFDGSLNWYLQNPYHIFMIWEGGFTFYGGFLFALIAGILYVRRHGLVAWNIGDMIAPGL